MTQTNRIAILALLALIVLAAGARHWCSDEFHLSRYARQIEQRLNRYETRAGKLVSQAPLSPEITSKSWGLESFNLVWYRADSLLFSLQNRFVPETKNPKQAYHLLEDAAITYVGRMYPEQAKGHYAIAWIPVWADPALAEAPLRAGFFDLPGIPETVFPETAVSGFAVKGSTGAPLFYLHTEDTVLDRAEEGLIWILFAGIALALAYLAGGAATRLSRRKSPWWGLALLVILLTVLRLLLFYSGHIPLLDQLLPQPPAVFQETVQGQTMGGLLFNTLLLLWLMIFFHREFQDLLFPAMPWAAAVLTGAVNYFSLILGMALVAQTIRNLMLRSGLNIYFDNIFEINADGAWSLIILILLFLAFFLFSHRMTKAIFSLGMTANMRMAAFSISVLIAAPIYFGLRIPFPAEAFLLAVVVYVWLMDLFSETGRPNLTWMILWLGIIAAFTAILLSGFRLEKEDQIQRDIAYQLGQTDRAFLSEYLHAQHPSGLQPFIAPHALPGLPQMAELENLEFALYTGGLLTSQSPGGLFPLKEPQTTPLNAQEPLRVTGQGGRVEWHIRSISGDRVVVRRTVGNIMGPISLFSYLFALFILAMPLLALANHWMPFLPPSLEFIPSRSPTLSGRIQLWTVGFLIVSFLLIGFFSVWNFRQNADFNQEVQVKARLDAIREEADLQIQQLPDTAATTDIFELLRKLGDYHQADLLIYDTLGRLQASTLPLESLSPLFSRQMSDPARYALTAGNAPVNLQRERLGELRLRTAYLPVRDATGALSAFVGLPFSDQPGSWQNELSGFISALINVYVFLLLFAGAFAIYIADSITEPISRLGERLRTIKLGKENKPLEYEREDEVGALIGEYNQMLAKLEESTRELARAERDIAWREMAKQVGHEIKNPLTPITLQIQNLPMALELKPEKTEQIVKNTIEVIMEQVEILKSISTAFSQFAKMPDPEPSTFPIDELVKNVHALFRNEGNGFDFPLSLPENPIYVYADKDQMVRVLNNLLKNAIQAIPGDKQGCIATEVFLREDDIIAIEIRDNGSGIPEEMREKIFVPNFTTKSSGTGLGLAMVKDMVELAKGKVYFETELGQGTSFFVELPVIDAPGA